VDGPAYLEQIVDPTIAEFDKNPYSRRHAFLACLVTFHTIDYIEPREPQKRSAREAFRKESDAFAVIDRVAHAFKHVKTGHSKSEYNRPLRVEHVYSRPPAITGVMRTGISRLGDTTGGVALWGENSTDLLPIVKQASKFLRSKRK
jgi:hypothetical protein